MNISDFSLRRKKVAYKVSDYFIFFADKFWIMIK